MNQLYPLKLKAIFKEKIWGGQNLKPTLNKQIPIGEKIGESWEISGVEGNISIVANGFLEGNELTELIEVYMGDLVGDRIYEQFGTEFPLLIKYIDANDVLSIQVHPDDNLALERHNSSGKTEMWYIVDCKKDAELISGFNHEMDKNHYLMHLNNNEITQIVNYEKVNKGDVFYIPAGRIHAIGAGIVLAEIQQTSDITYRIFDWNRKDEKGNYRELHTEQALDAIDFKKYDSYKTNYQAIPNISSPILNTPYFNSSILEFDRTLEKNYNQLDCFVIYMCVDGKFEIEFNESEKITIEKGETVLIPAVLEHLTLKPVTRSKVIEVYIPEKDDEKSASR